MAFSSAYCDVLPPANDVLTRFDARYFHLDFPLSAVATIIANDSKKLVVNYEGRSNRDLFGLLWTSADKNGHPYLEYVEDKDYSGVKFGFVANPIYPFDFTVTIGGSSGSQIYRMFPYSISGGSLVPDSSDRASHGNGPGLSYSISDIFPDGTPTIPSGHHIFILDFDHLVTGFNYDGDVIDPRYIHKLFFSLVPSNYGIGPNAYMWTVGAINYYKYGLLKVKHGVPLAYWPIMNVNQNLNLKKGDILQAIVAQPDVRVGTTTGGKLSTALGDDTGVYAIYTPKITTLYITLKEWDLSGGNLFVKIDDGPLSNVAFIGGKVIGYSLQSDTGIGIDSYTFEMSEISVTGDRRQIGLRWYPQDVHQMQMTSGLDDTYNITPWRQVANTYFLGYRGNFNLYMGMSHYFKAKGENINGVFVNKILYDEEEPLNYPVQQWCYNFFSQMQAYGYKFIWSTSFEILNTYMPDTWKQRNYLGEPGLSGWSPPSAFFIPTRNDCMDYIARVIKHGMKLLSESGITELMFQIGEPWWWDGSYTNGSPCIYDESTKSTYVSETGNSVPVPFIQNYMEPVTEEQRPYLEWLGTKLGLATNYIRDAVKASYPTAKGTLLFFSPQVMNPASEMLTIINFPESEWVYPNYDFVQIEDYDWIIDGRLDLVPLTFQAATEKLGYPLSVVHYFVGFVNYSYQTWVWPSINLAVRLAKLANIPNIYVWAYPQVIRDGILYNDSLIGTEQAIMPVVERHRQIDDAVENGIVRMIYLCQVGDDSFLCSADRNITFDDKIWYATGRFGKIENLKEEISGIDQGWTMSLSAIPLQYIDYVVDSMRAKKVKLYIGLLDENYTLLSNPKLLGIGNILDNDVSFDDTYATIQVNVRSKLTDWHRISASRYTDEYQQTLHPGDRGFKFMVSLQNTKLNWGE